MELKVTFLTFIDFQRFYEHVKIVAEQQNNVPRNVITVK